MDRSPLKFLYLFFLILISLPLLYRSFYSDLPFVANPWVALHMSYMEYGFIKRGLVATVLDVMHLQTRMAIVAYTVISLAIFLYFFLSCSEKIAKSFKVDQQWVVFFFLSLNPLTLFNVGWDAGRSDILGLILFIASVKFLNRNVLLASFFCCLGILNHEIYALLWMPPLMLMLFLTENPARRYSKLLTLMFLPGLAFLLLFLYGRYEEGPLILQALQMADTGHIEVEVWTRSLAENFDLCMGFYKDSSFIRDYLISLVYFLACVFVVHLLTAQYGVKRKLIIFVPFLSVVPLSLLGLDVFRWLSLSFITAVILMGEKEMVADSRIDIGSNKLAFAKVVIFVGIIIGPIGVHESFPLLKRLF